ncbi:helix-turn-helix domain-containing protein [Aquimarina litoralis]|uniref:helix-turn-helix domain-containing protein n=1 Tax=Aquimarina litoralis TaxID=584605 RepID=UPI001C55F734|nr:AraC family transcriptional regulator [Aquimarina litoralis]MBW1296763.1 helix-turn-helix domain-containing protein [Aquimarina litoralis]
MKLILDFILVAGLVASLLIIYKIKRVNVKSFSHLILALIFVFIIITILNFYSILHDIYMLYVVTFLFEDGSRLLIGGLLYIYIKSIFIERTRLYKPLFFHVIPYVLYLLIFSLPGLLVFTGANVNFEHLILLKYTSNLNLFKAIYLLIYIVISLRLFRFYKEQYKQDYSAFSNANFIWVERFLLGALIVICIDICTFLGDYLYDINFDTSFITATVLILIIFYLGNYGVDQPFVFLSNPLESTIASNKNTFSETEIDTLKSRIEQILDGDKLYLDPELTLKNLADEVGITEKKLSFFLNQELNTSFYDVINSYRIKEFKERIDEEENEKYSVLGIAYTCGFNSKSSFYRIFKKETGVSPAQYKKAARNKS